MSQRWRVAVFCLLLTGSSRVSTGAWSWGPSDQYAPSAALFQSRGTVQIAQGAQYAAPGVPPASQALYGVLRYRDTLESFRNYDLFFTPSLAISKLLRYEPDGGGTQFLVQARALTKGHRIRQKYNERREQFQKWISHIYFPSVTTATARPPRVTSSL